jgi:hypothetical protein
MVILNEHTVIPFIMQQQLHRPPAIMVQRFCSIAADTLSSHAQTIFIPPLHFSKVIVQRGTIIMFAPAGAVAAVPITPVGPVTFTPAIPIPARSIITAVVIRNPPSIGKSKHRRSSPSRGSTHCDHMARLLQVSTGENTYESHSDLKAKDYHRCND